MDLILIGLGGVLLAVVSAACLRLSQGPEDAPRAAGLKHTKVSR